MNRTSTISDLLVKEQQQAVFDLISPMPKTVGNIRRTKGMAKLEAFAGDEAAILSLVDTLRRYPFDFGKGDADYCALMTLLALSPCKCAQGYRHDLIQYYIRNHRTGELLFWSELLHCFGQRDHLAFIYNLVAGYFYRARRTQKAEAKRRLSELELQTAERFMPELLPQTFYDTVMRNSQDVWNPHQLAERCGYTYHTFRKLFSEQFGCSPVQWMQQQRLELIRYLLTETELEFQEIAARCGFAGHNYLWDFCRNYFHDTPKNLRRQWREGKSGMHIPVVFPD